MRLLCGELQLAASQIPLLLLYYFFFFKECMAAIAPTGGLWVSFQGKVGVLGHPSPCHAQEVRVP